MVDRTTLEQGGSRPDTSPVPPDDRRRIFAERSVEHLSRLLRYARVELSAQEALGESTREFLRARLAEEYRDVPGDPPSEAIFQRLHRPTATPEHTARIERQLAERSR